MSRKPLVKRYSVYSGGVLLHDKAIGSIIDELRTQTARGIAVIGGAILDSGLKDVLLASLSRDVAIRREVNSRPDDLWTSAREEQSQQQHKLAESVASSLFQDGTGPLGSFGSRISLAYLMSITGPQTHQDLKIIKEIRNQFAHVELASDAEEKPVTLDFTMKGIVALCAKLKACRNTTVRVYNEEWRFDTGPKDQFRLTVLDIGRGLSSFLEHLKWKTPFDPKWLP